MMLTFAALLCGTARAASVDDALRAARYGDVGPVEAVLGEIRDPAVATLARLELAAANLDGPAVQRDLATYLASGDQDPVRQARVWALVTSVNFARGNYAAAAD